MIIKVCGLRDPENIRAIEQLNIDWMGFIFWSESPRYVSMIHSRAGIIPDYNPLPGEQLKTARQTERKGPKRVGVFVDDMPQSIVTRVYNFNLDIVQLHGQESPTMIDNLRRTLDPDIQPGVRIMKAISIASADDLQKCKPYEGVADYFLFDTKCDTVGGGGKKFQWDILDHYTGTTPFLFSGGIGPDDVERIKAFHHPQCIGIDINSRFEREPGLKDVGAIEQFVQQIRS